MIRNMHPRLTPLGLLLLAAILAAGEPLAVGGLTCEHRTDPLAVDALQPRLGWIATTSVRGARQSAYRILVASDEAILARDIGDLWDTGRVTSDASVLVPYQGKVLTARQRCVWKVMAWDQDGTASPWSTPARFEIGLPTPADWGDARWMRLAGDPRTSPLAERPFQARTMPEPRQGRSHPAPLMRATFTVRPGLVRARAQVCGLGLHELHCNGRRVGEDQLQPAPTTYDQRALYCTYELTPLLVPGRNAVGLALGNGFYGQSLAFPGGRLGWDRPAALVRIDCDYADGGHDTVVSDGSWRATTGPVVFDNLYAGETHDARLERTGWSTVTGDDRDWRPVTLIDAPTQRVEAQALPPCRRITTITPVSSRRLADGRWLVDLGRNIAGWVRFTVREASGTTVTLRFAELLNPAGDGLDTASTGHFATGCEQIDVYVCRGGDEESWEPRFTYHGFRHVEVSGCTQEPRLTGVVVNTDLPATGTFTCAHPLLERIHQVSLWTLQGNIHGITEDCPHRERCAWLGDAHAQAPATLWNLGAGPLFAKLMDDVETVLGRGGHTYEKIKATPGIPCNIAVGRRLCQEARPDWGAAVVLLPWDVYRFTGDDRPIRDHWPLMRRWVDHVTAMARDGIVHQGYGDWCPPGSNSRMECPVPLSSTAYHIATLRLTADAARLLGHDDDARRLDADAARCHDAFNARFFRDGGYGSQTANVLALRFGLEPAGQRAAVGAALAREVVERHQGHACVGIHGGTGLFTLLADTGHADVAWDAMTRTTFPSHAALLDQGLTTWPEVPYPELHETARGRSQNHPMQAGFAAWFHDSVGGLRPLAPGFRRFALRPRFMRHLPAARVTHRSPYGLIVSAWERQGDAIVWTVQVPVGTEAIAAIPTDDGARVQEGGRPLADHQGLALTGQEAGTVICRLGSGTWRFTTPLAQRNAP